MALYINCSATRVRRHRIASSFVRSFAPLCQKMMSFILCVGYPPPHAHIASTCRPTLGNSPITWFISGTNTQTHTYMDIYIYIYEEIPHPQTIFPCSSVDPTLPSHHHPAIFYHSQSPISLHSTHGSLLGRISFWWHIASFHFQSPYHGLVCLAGFNVAFSLIHLQGQMKKCPSLTEGRRRWGRMVTTCFRTRSQSPGGCCAIGVSLVDYVGWYRVAQVAKTEEMRHTGGV